MSAPLAVVVLAGGEGRRMGGDKPLRRLGGVRLIDRAVALACAWSPLVAVSVRDPAQAGGGAGAPLILDRPGLEGPLAGLAAGLAFAARSGAGRLLTLPCDMPSLPLDLAERLCRALAAPDRAALPACGERVHPVCGLWDCEAAGALAGYAESGRSSVYGFARHVGARIVDWPPDSAAAFANVNSPEDLAALAAA